MEEPEQPAMEFLRPARACSNLSVEVGYLGNKGSNIMGQREYNRPEPGATPSCRAGDIRNTQAWR